MAPRRSLTGLAAQCSIFFFFFLPPSPLLLQKKRERDGLGESESEIEEDEGESFGVGLPGVLGGPRARGASPGQPPLRAVAPGPAPCGQARTQPASVATGPPPPQAPPGVDAPGQRAPRWARVSTDARVPGRCGCMLREQMWGEGVGREPPTLSNVSSTVQKAWVTGGPLTGGALLAKWVLSVC